MLDSFRQAYQKIGVPYGLPMELLEVFTAWYELLIKWNRKINLTKITDPSEVVIYHLADALPLSRLVPPDSTLLDIGSGTGVPGLIVAALRPDVVVTCAESIAKKAAFLTQAAAAMRLKNVKVENQRAEKLAGAWDVVTARAVADLGKMAVVFGKLASPQGCLIFFATDKTILPLNWPVGYRYQESIPYRLPSIGVSRSMIVLQKIGNSEN